MLSRGNGVPGAQVNFITEKSEVCSELRMEIFLNQRNLANRAPAKIRRDGRQSGIIQIPSQPQRHDGHTAYVRIKLCQIVDCASQYLAVINLWTKNNLRVNLDPGIDQLLNLAGNVRARFVDAKQISSDFEVGRVHGNILRRESLFDHATHFVIGDRSEGGVIPIKK